MSCFVSVVTAAYTNFVSDCGWVSPTYSLAACALSHYRITWSVITGLDVCAGLEGARYA